MPKDETNNISSTIAKKIGSIFSTPPFSFLYLNITLFAIYLVINEILVIGDRIQPYAAMDLIFSILVALLAMLIMGVFSIVGTVFFVKELKKPRNANTKRIKTILGLVALNLIPISILFIIDYCWYPLSSLF